MIDLPRCGAHEADRYLPAVATQGNASTYASMIDNSSMQARTQQMINDRGYAPAPDAEMGQPPAGQEQPQPDVWRTQRISPGLGPLPARQDGMSTAEQILHSSWKSLMARNVGRSVIVSFLIGTQNTIVTHGILYEVGNDYIALYQPDEQSYISADLYSIRFVEFLPEVTQTGSAQQNQ